MTIRITADLERVISLHYNSRTSPLYTCIYYNCGGSRQACGYDRGIAVPYLLVKALSRILPNRVTTISVAWSSTRKPARHGELCWHGSSRIKCHERNADLYTLRLSIFPRPATVVKDFEKLWANLGAQTNSSWWWMAIPRQHASSRHWWRRVRLFCTHDGSVGLFSCETFQRPIFNVKIVYKLTDSMHIPFCDRRQ